MHGEVTLLESYTKLTQSVLSVRNKLLKNGGDIYRSCDEKHIDEVNMIWHFENNSTEEFERAIYRLVDFGLAINEYSEED